MVLQKNGITYSLTDKIQIEAFIGAGWSADELNSLSEHAGFLSYADKEQLTEKPRQAQKTRGGK